MHDLDDATIAALTLPPGKARVKRSAGNGLTLWLTPGGRRRWFVRLPTGLDVPIEKGDWPSMNLAAARKACALMLAMHEHGVDLPKLRRETRQAQRKPRRAAKAIEGVPSFKTLANEFIEHQTAQGARPATLEKYQSFMNQLPAIFAKPADSLDVKTLADLYKRIAKKDDRFETAKRCAVFVGQVLERAAATTNLGGGPAFNARTAAKSVPKGEVTHHAAIVDPERFGQLLRAIDGYSGKSLIVREALKVLALTFPRPGELRSMRFAHLDLDAGVWIIPAANAKQKRVHRIFLPRQAVKILKVQLALQAHDDDDSAYVFPGVRTDRPMSENTLTAALNVLGFADEQSAHGFRASAKTMMHRELGIPRDVVELCLGHRLGDMVEQAYLHDDDDLNLAKERAKAMQRYADFCDTLREGNHSAKAASTRAR